MNNHNTEHLILRAISKEFDVTKEQILSRSRKGNFVIARQMYCYFLKERKGYTLKEVANITKRHHATVIHSINTIKAYLQVDKCIKNNIDNIFRNIHKEKLKKKH